MTIYELQQVKKREMIATGFGETFYDAEFESEGVNASRQLLQMFVDKALQNEITEEQFVVHLQMHFSAIYVEVEKDFWTKVERARNEAILVENASRVSTEKLQLIFGDSWKLPKKEQEFITQRFKKWQYNDSLDTFPIIVLEEILEYSY